MPSNWARKDVARQYGIAPKKIFAILYGVPTALYDSPTSQSLAQITRKFRLPELFAFYPAQTWAHKNHIRLLEAMALLRERERLSMNLVCTGRKNDFWRVIEKRIHELKLEKQVRFLGYVTATELRAIYHAAQFVIFPSLFEGGGLPVLEAFHEGIPVACSNVTALPEYGGDAALLFDPFSIESIADAWRRMTTDANLRETLRQRGSQRIGLFSWERTAKMYRALYRQVAGVPLSDEDQVLLTTSVGSE
jgi:glycosyltransferase involved in cell wall biosynthesis